MKKYACSVAKYGIDNQLCRKGSQGLSDKEMCEKCKLEYLKHIVEGGIKNDY